MKRMYEKEIKDLSKIEVAFMLWYDYASFTSDKFDNYKEILEEMKKLIVQEPPLIALLDRDMAEKIFID